MDSQGHRARRIDPTGSDDLARFIVTVAPNHSIFREGDWGNEMYVVQEGKVEISKAAGGRCVVGTGDFFGVAELLDGRERAFSARAVTRCRLVRLEFEAFRRVVHENPEIAIAILRVVLRRQRALGADESYGSYPAATEAGKEPVPLANPSGEEPQESRAAEPGESAPAPSKPLDDAPSVRGPDSKPPGEAAPPSDPFEDFVPDEDVAAGSADEGPLTVEAIAELDEGVLLTDRDAVLVHVGSRKEFPLPDGVDTMIGRRARGQSGPGPDLDLGSVDPQRTLSRRHATITRVREGFQLTELVGAENGTFLNGERVLPGVHVPLKDGDAIRLGYVKIVFKMR